MDARYLGNLSQIVGIDRVRLCGGKGDGMPVLRLHNRFLTADVLESKALDVGQVCYRGRNVSFLTKNGYDGCATKFSRAFCGGMLYTCGPESVGDREGFPLHGSMHNIPATVLRAEVTEEGDIIVQGEVCFTELFGADLCLKRTITLPHDVAVIRVEDELQNRGFRTEKYCMLYHVNFGYPFLTENMTLCFDAESTRSRTEIAARHAESCKKMQPPEDNLFEFVYFHTLKTPHVVAESPDSGIKATLSYSGDSLPCFVEWKSMASGDYALGLEPATTFLDGEFRYRDLAAGAAVRQTVELGLEDL